jgi:hypothetical protein
MNAATKKRLTPKAVEALVWARDNGSAWQYAPGKSLPWSSARDRMIKDLASKGLLNNAFEAKITDAGCAKLVKSNWRRVPK